MRTLTGFVGLGLLVSCSAALAILTPEEITPGGIADARWVRLNATELVAYGTPSGNQPYLWFASSTRHGMYWREGRGVSKPPGMQLQNTRLQFAPMTVQLGCLGAARSVANARDLPLWCMGSNATPDEGLLDDTPVPGAAMREVRGLFAADAIGQECWAAMADVNATGARTYRLLRSTDGGAHWRWESSTYGHTRPLSLLEQTPGRMVWGAFGGELMLVQTRTRPVYRFVANGAQGILDVAAPTDSDLYVFWSGSPSLTAPYTLMASNDRFTTSRYVGVSPYRPVAMDFADAQYGMVAYSLGGAPEKYALQTTRDCGRTWTGELAPGYQILDVDMVSGTEGYVLARIPTTGALYCLRWQPGPPVAAAVGLKMLDTSPQMVGLATATAAPQPPTWGTLVIGGAPASPMLAWPTASGPYAGTGLFPLEGKAGSSYSFRILYTHPANRAPVEVRLEFRDRAPLAMFEYQRLGPGYGRGVIYETMLAPETFTKPGTYQYRFTASDGNKAAAGPPTQWEDGRVLTIVP